MNQPETANDFAELLESAQYSHQVSVEAFRWIAAELRRLAELERDAARYRWLVANMDHDGFGYWLPEICVQEGRVRPQKDQCDAVIDAAMGEAK